jgi:hypothetical protein
VATFGQSFHWMERARVAAIIFAMLEPGGAFVHVSGVKDAPSATGVDLPQPLPPYAAMQDLVQCYWGPIPRAGQGVLRYGTPASEDAVVSAAGFVGFERLRVPAGEVLIRSDDDIVAWVFSRSSSAPHLFGDRRNEFEAQSRRVLHEAAPSRWFAEGAPTTEVFIWRKPGTG